MTGRFGVTGPGSLGRLALLAFPRSFRREFGEDYLQTVADLRRHSGVGGRPLALRIAFDVLRTAPAMRMETAMSKSNFKPIALTAVLAIGLFAVVAGSPAFGLAVGAAFGLLVLLALFARAGNRPIVAEHRHAAHWYGWVAAGACSFALGFGVLAVDGPELSSVGWTVTMLSWATGVVLVVFGLVLVIGRLLNERAARMQPRGHV